MIYEWWNIIIMEIVGSMLKYVKLNRNIWVKEVKIIIYLLNREPFKYHFLIWHLKKHVQEWNHLSYIFEYLVSLPIYVFPKRKERNWMTSPWHAFFLGIILANSKATNPWILLSKYLYKHIYHFWWNWWFFN